MCLCGRVCAHPECTHGVWLCSIISHGRVQCSWLHLVDVCVFELHMTHKLLYVCFSGFSEDNVTAKCRVITIDGAFEVNVGPFNVRKFFGDGAVLLDSSGVPVLTDEWGVTLNSLHHGVDYFLVCNFFL